MQKYDYEGQKFFVLIKIPRFQHYRAITGTLQAPITHSHGQGKRFSYWDAELLLKFFRYFGIPCKVRMRSGMARENMPRIEFENGSKI